MQIALKPTLTLDNMLGAIQLIRQGQEQHINLTQLTYDSDNCDKS